MDDSQTRITRQCSVEDIAILHQRASLVHIYPPGADIGKRYDLSGLTEIIIGRVPECQVRIDGNSASRRHARIALGDNGWQIEDLGSTNGSYVNDARITHHKLRSGDLLKIGNGAFNGSMQHYY